MFVMDNESLQSCSESVRYKPLVIIGNDNNTNELIFDNNNYTKIHTREISQFYNTHTHILIKHETSNYSRKYSN